MPALRGTGNGERHARHRDPGDRAVRSAQAEHLVTSRGSGTERHPRGMPFLRQRRPVVLHQTPPRRQRSSAHQRPVGHSQNALGRLVGDDDVAVGPEDDQSDLKGSQHHGGVQSASRTCVHLGGGCVARHSTGTFIGGAPARRWRRQPATFGDPDRTGHVICVPRLRRCEAAPEVRVRARPRARLHYGRHSGSVKRTGPLPTPWRMAARRLATPPPGGRAAQCEEDMTLTPFPAEHLALT